MFVDDYRAALAGMIRALRSGGLCILVSWNERLELLRPLISAAATLMPNSLSQQLASPREWGDPAECKSRFEAAGFREVVMLETTHVLTLGSRKDYIHGLLLSNPNGIQLRRQLCREDVKAMDAQIDAELAPEFGDGAIGLCGVANVMVGYKP